MPVNDTKPLPPAELGDCVAHLARTDPDVWEVLCWDTCEYKRVPVWHYVCEFTGPDAEERARFHAVRINGIGSSEGP